MAMKPTDQEIGALYREGGTAGPSEALDRNILAAARAAVDTPPAPASWWSRWRLPLQATVAVCLVAMVAVMVGHRGPSGPAVPPLAMNQAGPAAESRLAAPATSAAATLAPASNDRAAEAPQARARSETKGVATMSPPVATPALSVPPAAPASQTASRENALAAAPTSNTVTAETESAVPLAKSETGAAPAAKAAARVAADQSSPKDWLDSIQVLIDQNRLDDARKRLEAFTRAYPGEAIPETMRARLKIMPEGSYAKPP
jgi:hypothetical protein